MIPSYKNLAKTADLPSWEKRAADEGKVVDHYPLYPGNHDLIAIRLVGSIEERDEARAYRQLNLDLPQR